MLLLIGHLNGRERAPMPSIHEDVRRLLGEKSASLIWAASQFGSTVDPEQRLMALQIQARRVLESLDLYQFRRYEISISSWQFTLADSKMKMSSVDNINCWHFCNVKISLLRKQVWYADALCICTHRSFISSKSVHHIIL